MNKSLEDYIRRLKLEDVIWLAYISLGILNIIANKYEKEYVICKNEEDRITFRSINVFIFLAAIFVYVFFLIKNVKYSSNKNNDENIGKLNNLSIIASLLFITAAFINLHVEVNGFGRELEI